MINSVFYIHVPSHVLLMAYHGVFLGVHNVVDLNVHKAMSYSVVLFCVDALVLPSSIYFSIGDPLPPLLYPLALHSLRLQALLSYWWVAKGFSNCLACLPASIL